MANGALDPHKSKGWYQQLIDDINHALLIASIASTGGTVTTALANLATERDKH